MAHITIDEARQKGLTPHAATLLRNLSGLLEEDPVEYEGHLWVSRSYLEWEEETGLSTWHFRQAHRELRGLRVMINVVRKVGSDVRPLSRIDREAYAAIPEGSPPWDPTKMPVPKNQKSGKTYPYRPREKASGSSGFTLQASYFPSVWGPTYPNSSVSMSISMNLLSSGSSLLSTPTSCEKRGFQEVGNNKKIRKKKERKKKEKISSCYVVLASLGAKTPESGNQLQGAGEESKQASGLRPEPSGDTPPSLRSGNVIPFPSVPKPVAPNPEPEEPIMRVEDVKARLEAKFAAATPKAQDKACTVSGLHMAWRNQVARKTGTYVSGHMSGPDIGCLKRLLKVAPTGQGPELLEYLVEHWTPYVDFLTAQWGAFKLPANPMLWVVSKFADQSVTFWHQHRAASVKLEAKIAQQAKAVQSIAKAPTAQIDMSWIEARSHELFEEDYADKMEGIEPNADHKAEARKNRLPLYVAQLLAKPQDLPPEAFLPALKTA